MAWGRRTEGGGCLARLALLVALLALVLAWAAYRRQGGEIKTLWKDLTRGAGGDVAAGASATVERQTDLAQAQARLLRRRAEVATDRNLQQVREDVAQVRANLERTYRDASGGAKARWRDLDADLERLQGELKLGGSKALAALDSALAKIRKEKDEQHR